MVDTALYHLMSQENAEEPSTKETDSADAEKVVDNKRNFKTQPGITSSSSKRGSAVYKLTSILGTTSTSYTHIRVTDHHVTQTEMLAVANQLEILIAQAMMMRRSEWQQHLQVELSSDRQTLRIRYWQSVILSLVNQSVLHADELDMGLGGTQNPLSRASEGRCPLLLRAALMVARSCYPSSHTSRKGAMLA